MRGLRCMLTRKVNLRVDTFSIGRQTILRGVVPLVCVSVYLNTFLSGLPPCCMVMCYSTISRWLTPITKTYLFKYIEIINLEKLNFLDKTL